MHFFSFGVQISKPVQIVVFLAVLSVVFGFPAFNAFAAPGDFQFAKRVVGDGSSYNYIYKIAHDSNDRIILVTETWGDVDLDGDGDPLDDPAESGVGYSGNDGSTSDIVIAVYNSSGTLQWAKRLGGTSYDAGYSITVDSQDNIIVTGYI